MHEIPATKIRYTAVSVTASSGYSIFGHLSYLAVIITLPTLLTEPKMHTRYNLSPVLNPDLLFYSICFRLSLR